MGRRASRLLHWRALVTAATPAATRTRVESIDLLRGLVMVIMALDHARDFLAIPGLNPVNVATTTVPLFFTRWITHLCAPTFFLLAGTGARLALGRRSKRQLSWFLFTRGLWLIFLELVVLRGLAWQFNFDFHVVMLFILWAIGWAMITLAVLVFLPDWVIAAFSLVLIAGHNLLDPIDPSALGRFAPLWNILHVNGLILNTPGHQIVVAYPLIPWIAVTPLGYVFGRIFTSEPARRRRFLLCAGLALCAAFVVLRAINRYGDPAPWSAQKSAAFTLISFLNVNKYPPSLLFLLMTLGPAPLLLRALESSGQPRPDAGRLSSARRTPAWLRPLLVYGRVPLLYFGLHAALLHLIAVAICAIRYGHVFWMFRSPTIASFPMETPPGWGLTLPWIYLIWIAVVVALYPICRWFADLKRRRSEAWLSYL